MTKQPQNNNNDNQFDSDLEVIENALNSIMQGALSSMFRQLIDPSIFENAGNNIFPGVSNSSHSITTVYDGRNVASRVPASAVVEEDGYGGNDFKRLAKKSKENRGIATTDGENLTADSVVSATTTTASPAGMIFNLLFQQPPAEIFHKNQEPDSIAGNKRPLVNGGWSSFTSTSTRTILQPDGTQETIITKRSNGTTETIKQIRYADGHVEETKEKSSFWKRLFGNK
ncbi:hypothetical protein [Parasitella parasitica]|uniref:Uncharacterized protein n=1 Tax=Parasitella parasitica TaxID=35722 RepID=A0A0B7NUI6_9FUNG|nr:hypothetical protein [Parasitella parasitica]